MWLVLLRRFGPYLAVGAAIVTLGWYIYSAGKAAERAEWEPRFAAAATAKAEADARAEAKESLAKRLSAESDTRYADTIFRLNERAVDASRDIRQLVHLISASRQQVPPDGPASRGSDEPTEIDPSVDGLGERFARIGSQCEADAAQLAELQRYVSGQLAALN